MGNPRSRVSHDSIMQFTLFLLGTLSGLGGILIKLRDLILLPHWIILKITLQGVKQYLLNLFICLFVCLSIKLIIRSGDRETKVQTECQIYQ